MVPTFVWVLLVAPLVGSCQFFASAEGGGVGLSGLVGYLPAFTIGVFIVVFALAIRHQRAAGARNTEGLTLLSEGRYSAALQAFQEGAKPRSSAQLPVLRYNVAIARLYLWQLAEAEAELVEARRPSFGTDLRTLVVPQHALVLALQGRAAEAEAVIAEAEGLELGSHAAVLVSRGVLAARAGDWAAAAAYLRRREVKQLGGSVRALADAILAWAIHQQTGARRYVDRITLFGETGPERLRRYWPELTAFLESAPQA